MSDPSCGAEHYRDLAEECRLLATTTLSTQMRNRYSLMAKDYILLADIEEQCRASTACRINCSDLTNSASRTLRHVPFPRYDPTISA
jgi:hypothetical protein